jgi:hypothetical protein
LGNDGKGAQGHRTLQSRTEGEEMKRKMTNREYIKRYFPHKVSKKILGYAHEDFLQREKIYISDDSIERKRSNIVALAFLWVYTNEGTDYWRRIYDKLIKAGK